MLEVKPIPGFDAWLEGCVSDIEQVEEYLSEKLSDNPSVLVDQLAAIEAWQGRMVTLLAEANGFLAIAERKAITERLDEWTDLDRRSNQKAATVNERKFRDILAGICESIKMRLILGMSIIKGNKTEQHALNP